MLEIIYVRGHIEVYGADGTFLFSADDLREANAMMEECYAQFQAASVL